MSAKALAAATKDRQSTAEGAGGDRRGRSCSDGRASAGNSARRCCATPGPPSASYLHHHKEPATALENPLRSAAAQRNERMATARLELATVCPRLRGHQPLHESLLEPLEASSCSKPSRKSYCAWRRCLKLLRRCRRSLVLLSMALLWRCASRMPSPAPPVALGLLATLATLT